MPYHLYCLDEGGKIRSDEWFDADSDEDAIANVRSMNMPFYCEIWDTHKQLAIIPPRWSG